MRLILIGTGVSLLNTMCFITLIVFFSQINGDIFKHSMVTPISIAIAIIIVADIIVGIHMTKGKIITAKQIICTIIFTIITQILIIGFIYFMLTFLGHLIVYILSKMWESFAHQMSSMG